MTLVPLRFRKTFAAIFMAIGLFVMACGTDAMATPIPARAAQCPVPGNRTLPNVNYYHLTNTLQPPMAGALTVPGSEITWDGSGWQLTSNLFVPAGTMHLANELNWVGPHLGSIPFPAKAG